MLIFRAAFLPHTYPTSINSLAQEYQKNILLTTVIGSHFWQREFGAELSMNRKWFPLAKLIETLATIVLGGICVESGNTKPYHSYPPLKRNVWKLDQTSLQIECDTYENISVVKTREALLKMGCGCKRGACGQGCKCLSCNNIVPKGVSSGQLRTMLKITK